MGLGGWVQGGTGDRRNCFWLLVSFFLGAAPIGAHQCHSCMHVLLCIALQWPRMLPSPPTTQAFLPHCTDQR